MINLYLCTVRTIVLTTPLSAGSKTLSPLLHFRSHLFGWLLFFIESSEKLVKICLKLWRQGLGSATKR